MKIQKEIEAITRKELLLYLRFKLSYFFIAFVNPLLELIPFGIIYYGFLTYSGATSFAGIDKANYLVFLIFGVLAHAFFNTGLHIFSAKFTEEKYWKTLEAIFIAPINYLSLIIGVGLSEIIRLAPTILLFFAIASFFFFPNIEIIIISLLSIFLIFLLCLSVGLIYGSIVVGNENFRPALSYLFTGWSLASCFFYPIGIIPEMFRPIILANPVYHGVNIMRNAWMHLPIDYFSLAYLAITALVLPIIAVYIFRFCWKRLYITGY